MDEERWLPVPHNQNYDVSSHGNVRSWLTQRGARSAEPKLKALTVGTHGYYQVNLQGKLCVVHRLVLEAFAGSASPGMECCHSDGNRLNNRVENLRWDTRSANSRDTLKHGTHNHGNPGRPKNVGAAHGRAKLTDAMIVEIRTSAESGTAIANRLGTSKANVSHIRAGKRWKHVG